MTNSAWKGSLRNVAKAETTWASAQLKTGVPYYQKEKPLAVETVSIYYWHKDV